MCHSSIDPQTGLPFHLTGSQKKTAFALEKNVARMVEEAGIDRIGFLTLTVGEMVEDCFQQVWDPEEASRRINSLAGLLRIVFPRSIIVTERHKSGAIHFHLIVECREDIRTGFDFEALWAMHQASRNGEVDEAAVDAVAASATPALRELWKLLRDRLPGYGFGRAELTPIYKCAEAISRYVSKYVEKNLFNRLKEDRGKKLVRYMGWKKTQMKPNEFCWGTPAATEWRLRARAIAQTLGISSTSQAAAAFGPRWAFRLSRVMNLAEQIAHVEWGVWVDMVRECAYHELVYEHWDLDMDAQRRYEEFGDGPVDHTPPISLDELAEHWRNAA